MSKENQKWTKDELLLTLDLYFKTHPKERDKNNPKIKEIAALIDRTPASVVYRLGNYAAFDFSATIKGFSHGGKEVERFFKAYSVDKWELHRNAEAIKIKLKGTDGYLKGGIRRFMEHGEFETEYLEERLQLCHKLRESFLRRWPREKLGQLLTIESYIIGEGNEDSFCYWIERKTRVLGSILGATADKFKIYYSKKDGAYKWVKPFKSAEEAFDATKSSVIALLDAASSNDLSAIKSNSLFKNSHLLRGKILALYFPEKFLNVFAEDDINYFLEKFGISFDLEEHVMDKQRKLLEYKEKTPELAEWDNLKYGYFLYSQFAPPSRKIAVAQNYPTRKTYDAKTLLAEEGAYVLPDIAEIALVEIALNEICPIVKSGRERHKKPFKANYLLESMRNHKLGDQAEEIVLKYEKEELSKLGKKYLAKRVQRVSLDDDSLGYDIASFEFDGSPKYIDVKGTRSGVEKALPFYLTDNEKKVMGLKGAAYYLYRVFGANTKSPKLLKINASIFESRCHLVPKLWEITVQP